MTNKVAKSRYADLYPWISTLNSVEEYVSPAYYNRLLKKYSFSKLPDISYFEAFIKDSNASEVLELGFGSGRVSKVALKKLPMAHFTLVDLSERMIEYTEKSFKGKRNITFKQQDAIEFLRDTTDAYDLTYSLWSFSHSIHQHVHRLGFKKALELVEKTLTKFIRKNMVKGSKFFLMHFDSMSEEQRILMRQWKRVFPEFSDVSQQSPSKRILDSALLNLDNRNKIGLSIKHMPGDQITYSSEEEVLEIFLNFHMETYFNQSLKLPAVMRDIKQQVATYRQKDGTYTIQPGCYIYSFEKVDLTPKFQTTFSTRLSVNIVSYEKVSYCS